MTCGESQQLMSLHLIGVLPEPQVITFEAHLLECAICRADWMQQKIAIYEFEKNESHIFERLPKVIVPKGLVDRAFHRWLSGC